LIARICVPTPFVYLANITHFSRGNEAISNPQEG